ncbi:AraC family transcriptional regulator [Paenibacillus selenitireducens]|uniref:AraC family transcriptional regulator n=1 Tax=Paenibacillus selenitireducens TaxID=1324314 RepID=A0A1T2XMI2_9BACL|nr:helix-turn-helix domain-containing protein [Paenibacillus selenitireducens]OPA80956.1 AraC family transcriptional regulator [Paenibacillus selenitireducens]
MKDIVSEWAESHFPLYTADSILSIYSSSNFPMYKINESLPVLIAIVRGKGNLKADEEMYELLEGSVIFIPANTEVVLNADSLHPLHVYKLVIDAREQGKSLPTGAMMRKSDINTNSVIQFFSNEPSLVSNMEELYIHRLPGNEFRHVQNQIIFHQIILQLLERQEDKYAAGEQPSMERSIAYLELHYSDKITRERLAEIAGVSPSHYSILFKQMTGFSPSEYLSRLRVHRAKELLISGSATLREIAQQVGYKDEFYLSRRFKQQTGAAPSGYNRESFQRVAVFLTPYASHLLLLGLEPAVIISDSSEYLHTSGLQLPQKMLFINANSSAEQIKSVLLENKIELIIAANQHLYQYGLSVEQLRSVAPLAEISWMEVGWKEHFRLIAQLIQRKDRAEQWLADFEIEEQEARTWVQQSEAAKEVITILVIKPESLFVYGARNVGCVIYQSLGLQAPPRIQEEIVKLGDQFHSVPIELSELADYAGDRILVIVFPDVKGSTVHSDTVFNSVYWNSLSAVQRNDVHLLDLDEWIPYNPVSIRLQLQRAVSLFSGN